MFSIVAFGLDLAGRPIVDKPFFETPALLIVLVHIGRSVQAATRRTTNRAFGQSLALQPRSALLLDGENERVIDSRLLHLGDMLRVLPASSVPTDGIVINGSSEVDESAITGESVPVRKAHASRLVAGTTNLTASLDMAAGALPSDNSLATMADLVRSAQATATPIQGTVDRLSAIILPLALTCAALAFVAWAIVDVFVRGYSVGRAIVDALTYAIAVLVVSCPCALGLAVRVPLVAARPEADMLKDRTLLGSTDHLGRSHLGPA